ncbi:MAG: hypothetical protein JST40_01565 [Armatimonadetes bacterium]|nr:hypothetical protein [Armatimonadota bacterium]
MSKKQPNHDPGVELIKRYMLLTLAMGDAVNQSRFDDFSSLLKERELTILELEGLPQLSQQAIREFNIAVGLDDDLQAQMKAIQSENVKNLVEFHQGKAGKQAYKKTQKAA